MKPKVLRIFNRLILGGPVLNALILTKYQATNFDTELVSGIKDEKEQDADYLIKKYNVSPTYINQMRRSLNPFQDFIAYLQLKKHIKNTQPKIVHTHASKPGLLGRLAASHCKVPVIIHTFHGHACHNYFGKLKTKLYILTERYMASKSTRIIAISEQQKIELGTIYKICEPQKIVVIPLGFELNNFYENQEIKRQEFRKQYDIKPNEIAIGIVGRLVPIKNHKLFLDAVASMMQKTTKQVRIIIVGDGEELENMQQNILSHNLKYNYYPTNAKAEAFTFTSWISEMDIVYAGLDIVCLSSLNEGTPVSLIEAQAASKPIVTTNVGGVIDVVLENETALITPTENTNAFAEAILSLVENEELRKKLGSNGLKNVQARYDKSRLVSDMNKLYESLLDN